MKRILRVIWWAFAVYDLCIIVWCLRFSHFTQKTVGLTNFALARLFCIAGVGIALFYDGGAAWIASWMFFAGAWIFQTTVLERQWHEWGIRDRPWINHGLYSFFVPRLAMSFLAHAMIGLCLIMPGLLIETMTTVCAAVALYLASCTPMPPGGNRLRERLYDLVKASEQLAKPQDAAT